MVRKSYIIPARFFHGDMGRLQRENYDLWSALIDRDRLDWESRQEDLFDWFRSHGKL